MTDDYKKGLVTGLAMQPLYVTTGAEISDRVGIAEKLQSKNASMAVTTGNNIVNLEVGGTAVAQILASNQLLWINSPKSGFIQFDNAKNGGLFLNAQCAGTPHINILAGGAAIDIISGSYVRLTDGTNELRMNNLGLFYNNKKVLTEE